MAPTLYFGLLGSCYQQNKSSSLECTKLSFPADYTTTISRAGSIVNSEHLQISMPDLPPVFGVWALISLLGSFCHLIGSLPFYFFNQLNHLRFLSKPFFSASLWILGIGWAFGFSAVLSLACFDLVMNILDSHLYLF
ncbi:uncharacterized protein MELLADRAFT_95049 [Melampsora larici-populina 98AG31]|uniref:Uncharacterized protein n=1 Tax=Melampsora larici-populina (strain 98AG31 / pathotype 3-4-7) TaxID=747676 RepID=F4S8X6_MELLP|nr:uncharacterized protein MELLADRAFT_95049 [Melampsora larici-populina 98AG31]EGF98914.1 hypothetical protein MELLADRAFT_95049 [Melampsora larici-populina 98AG31]